MRVILAGRALDQAHRGRSGLVRLLHLLLHFSTIVSPPSHGAAT